MKNLEKVLFEEELRELERVGFIDVKYYNLSNKNYALVKLKTGESILYCKKDDIYDFVCEMLKA